MTGLAPRSGDRTTAVRPALRHTPGGSQQRKGHERRGPRTTWIPGAPDRQLASPSHPGATHRAPSLHKPPAGRSPPHACATHGRKGEPGRGGDGPCHRPGPGQCLEKHRFPLGLPGLEGHVQAQLGDGQSWPHPVLLQMDGRGRGGVPGEGAGHAADGSLIPKEPPGTSFWKDVQFSPEAPLPWPHTAVRGTHLVASCFPST